MLNKILLCAIAASALLHAEVKVYEPVDTTEKKDVVVVEDRFDDLFQKDSAYLGIAFGNTKIDGMSGIASSLILGMKISDYMAFELRYSSIVGDAENSAGETATLRNIAAYVKQFIPLDYKVKPYALLGYGKTTYGNLSDSQMQWGAGVSYVYKSDLTIFADYESQYRGNFEKEITEDKEMKSFKLGTTYAF